jgi:hypothetical protein
MTRIAEKSPVFGLFYQNIVFGPPFNFEPAVLSGKGPQPYIFEFKIAFALNY